MVKHTPAPIGGRRRKTMKKGGRKSRRVASKKTRKGRSRRSRRGGMERDLTPEELAMYKKFETLVSATQVREGSTAEEVAKAAAELAKFEETIPADLKPRFEEMLAESGAAASGE